MSDCSDLIGLPYRLGADGSDGYIDCIHLCYQALERMSIDAPPFKQSWYEASKWQVCRDLLAWGSRVDQPQYDGDILLLPERSWTFAVMWATGILYVHPVLEKTQWSSAQLFLKYHCFRMKSS
jgi:hypothetical protein